MVNEPNIGKQCVIVPTPKLQFYRKLSVYRQISSFSIGPLGNEYAFKGVNVVYHHFSLTPLTLGPTKNSLEFELRESTPGSKSNRMSKLFFYFARIRASVFHSF